MEITLNADVRKESGKGPARRARMAGKVPAVLYGSAIDPVSLLVDAKEMTHALHTEAGSNVLINLQLLGSSDNFLTVAREIHKHPIKGNLIHVDFVNVARDAKIHAEVPVHLVGESHGVKEGGQIDHHLHDLRIEALPSNLPSAIEVDVEPLGIGDGIKVADLKLPEGVEALNDPDDLVVQVTEPTVMQVAEETGEPEAAAAEGATEAQAPAEEG